MRRDPQADRPNPSVDRTAAPGVGVGERILVGALTALLTARPLTAGDDPGRLSLISGTGPLVLNVLTFLLLFAWAMRRLCVRGPFRRGRPALIVVGLAVVGVLVFIDTAMPGRYQRPGWFIGWDWLSTAVVCFLTWQLMSTRARVAGLTAVFIATASCLSAQALYQFGSAQFGWQSTLPEKQPAAEAPLVGDDEFGMNLDQRPPPRGDFRATFDQPLSLASFLVLFLPSAAVFAFFSRRRGRPKYVPLLVPLVIAFGTALTLAAGPNWTGACSASRLLGFIEQAPAWGDGPGNLSRMAAGECIQAADYWLGFAATAGLAAAAVLLLTLGFALRSSFRHAGPSSSEVVVGDRRRKPWDFYAGGLVGLLLGMVLSIGDIPPESPATEILRLGVVGGFRLLVWVAAFYLLEMAAVKDRVRINAAIIGIALTMLLGCFCDALSGTALAQPFWVVLTLAAVGSLGSAPLAADPHDGPAMNWSAASLPYAITGVSLAMFLLGANLLHVAVPGCATASYARSARQASGQYAYLHFKTRENRGLEAIAATRDAAAFLEAEILRPLDHALKYDPNNSTLHLELARWRRNHWAYLRTLNQRQAAAEERREMLKSAETAAALDPNSVAPLFSSYTTLLWFADREPRASAELLDELERFISSIAQRRPGREVELRFRVALALLSGPNREALKPWALRVFQLDAEPGQPHGRLTGPQRTRLIVSIKKLFQQPDPDLAPYLVDIKE